MSGMRVVVVLVAVLVVVVAVGLVEVVVAVVAAVLLVVVAGVVELSRKGSKVSRVYDIDFVSAVVKGIRGWWYGNVWM